MEDMNFKTIKIPNLELDLNLWVEKVGKQGKIPLKLDPIPVLPVKSHLESAMSMDMAELEGGRDRRPSQIQPGDSMCTCERRMTNRLWNHVWKNGTRRMLIRKAAPTP